jgi:c-di-AMP phosphodiesterase-like protein
MNRLLAYSYGVIGIFIVLLAALLILVVKKNLFGIITVLAVLIGIVVYGVIRFNINLKTEDQLLQEVRHRNPQYKNEEIRIDIDDFKHNKNLRDDVLKKGYPNVKKLDDKEFKD